MDELELFMEAMEGFTLFTETTETIGLMYDSYKGLHDVISSFLDSIDQAVDQLIKAPEKTKIMLSDKIKEFKNDIDVKCTPSAINIHKISKHRSEVKKYRDKIDRTLDRYGRLKDKVAFGGNYFRAIINKPKVYSKDIDSDKYATINHNIRTVNRALDWVEKALLDLFNMADQDLNVLTVVGKTYAKRKIYEGSDIDVMDTEIDSETSVAYESDSTSSVTHESVSVMEESDIMDMEIDSETAVVYESDIMDMEIDTTPSMGE